MVQEKFAQEICRALWDATFQKTSWIKKIIIFKFKIFNQILILILYNRYHGVVNASAMFDIITCFKSVEEKQSSILSIFSGTPRDARENSVLEPYKICFLLAISLNLIQNLEFNVQLIRFWICLISPVWIRKPGLISFLTVRWRPQTQLICFLDCFSKLLGCIL